MQTLELLQLAKRHTQGQSIIKQCKNQAHSLSKLHLSEGISKGVNLSVGRNFD